jgi:hypothetical protein
VVYTQLLGSLFVLDRSLSLTEAPPLPHCLYVAVPASPLSKQPAVPEHGEGEGEGEVWRLQEHKQEGPAVRCDGPSGGRGGLRGLLCTRGASEDKERVPAGPVTAAAAATGGLSGQCSRMQEPCVSRVQCDATNISHTRSLRLHYGHSLPAVFVLTRVEA